MTLKIQKQTDSIQSLYYIQECGVCNQYMDTRREDVVLREPIWHHRRCWNLPVKTISSGVKIASFLINI